ncbi:hypothetical protein I3A86_25340 [Salmonella enterica]|nr:hypothetical protein [Salmonella enterica]
MTHADGRPAAEDAVARFACASADQAVVYLLARDRLDARGMVRRDGSPLGLSVSVPNLAAGSYRVTGWDTASGRASGATEQRQEEGTFALPPFAADIAVAITRCGE